MEIIKRSKRIVTIPFYSTVGASSSKTIRSYKLKGPISTLRFKMRFPRLAGGQLFYRWYYADTDEIPTTEPISNRRIWNDVTENDSWTGEDSTLWVTHQRTLDLPYVYIKLWVNNTYSATLPVDAMIEILM